MRWSSSMPCCARFIAETIDAEVYAQMGRRADGRPLARPARLAE
jgi:hypothetical protein